MNKISMGIRDISPGVPVEFETGNIDDFLMYGAGPFMADEDGIATGYDMPPELDTTGLGCGAVNSAIHESLSEIFTYHGLESCDLRGWSYDTGAIRSELRKLDLDDTPENIETVVSEIFPDNPEEITLSMIAYMSSYVRNYPSNTVQEGTIA